MPSWAHIINQQFLNWHNQNVPEQFWQRNFEPVVSFAMTPHRIGMTSHRTGIIKWRLDWFFANQFKCTRPTKLSNSTKDRYLACNIATKLVTLNIPGKFVIDIYAQYFIDCTCSIRTSFIFISIPLWTWNGLPINMTAGLFAWMLCLFVIYQGIIESRAPCILHDSFSTFDPKE